MPANVLTQTISWAETHDLFIAISDEFGFTAEEYSDEIADLILLWKRQGYVEIYEATKDKAYGRAKDSSKANGASPYYIGLFHVRLIKNSNDPLVVLVFEERGDETIASLRFMLEHDDMFGTKNEKFSNARMKQIRAKIDKFIQSGHDHVAD